MIIVYKNNLKYRTMVDVPNSLIRNLGEKKMFSVIGVPKLKVPKNTLKIKLTDRRIFKHHLDNFVKDISTIVWDYKIYTFKR